MKKLLFLFQLLWAGMGMAQNSPPKEVALEQLIEELFPLQEDDLDYEDIYEALFQYYRHPVDLNTATRQQLQSLYLLSDLQINRLLEHRQKFGKLLSMYELQSIAEFDLQTIQRLLPFVTVQDQGLTGDNRSLWQKIRQEDNNYLLLRYERTLETKKGYKLSENIAGGAPVRAYAGSPDKLYARYRMAHTNSFSIGFTVEKDAGEQLVWQPAARRYGTDFISGHMTLYNKGRFKSISLGDFQLQFGQGLVLAGGFATGKGSEPVSSSRRSNLGIRPYTSVMEAGFLRGAAVTYQIAKQWQTTLFYAANRLDGTTRTMWNETNQETTFISSIHTTGYHRTIHEINNKGTLLQQNAGTNLEYNSIDKNLQIGATLVGTMFDKAYIKSSNSYNQYDFRGKQHLNSSLYYSYNWQNFSFFGEAAHTFRAGSAMVQGLIASLSSKVEFSMVYRNYARNFSSFYGNAFGENTHNSNEAGMYWGLKIKPARQWTISAFYDRFQLPWLAYKADAPSKGHEWLSRISFTPNRSTHLYAQVRMETKERNLPNNPGKMDVLVNHYRKQYLLNLDFKAYPTLVLRSRVQMSSFQQNIPVTYGYVILQDLSWEPGRLKLSGRFALFDTDDYDNRQYVFERNVLYAFSFPAYYGRGIRTYLLAQYSLNSKLDLWCRIARTTFRDRHTIGSGWEAIEGNIKTDLSFQLRYKF